MKSPADSESAEGTIKEEVREWANKQSYAYYPNTEFDRLIDLTIQKTLAKAETEFEAKDKKLLEQIEQMKSDFEDYLKRQHTSKLPNIKMFPEKMDSLAIMEFVNTYTEDRVKEALASFKAGVLRKFYLKSEREIEDLESELRGTKELVEELINENKSFKAEAKKMFKKWYLKFVEDFEPKTDNKNLMNWWSQINNRIEGLEQRISEIGEKK